jgi:multiple sugar transport system substrate-binding protein
MKRLLMFGILAVVVMSFVFAGGGGQASGGKVTLTMVESLTNPTRTKVLREIADEYQRLHPNVVIEIVSPPLDGADQKIQQMLVNKNPIDVFEVRDSTVAQFSSNGFIEPLDDYVKNWSDFGTLVDTAKQTATQVGGKWYLIPYGFYERMMYYRKDWLAQAGIPVPTTLNELYDAAKKLTDPARGRYGFTLRGVSGSSGFVTNLAQAKIGSKGINLTDNGYTTAGKSVLDTPEALEAFEYIKKLYQDTCPADAIAWGFQDQCQAFTTGITAFLLQDPEVVAICEENMEDGTWGTAPQPIDDKSRQYPIFAGYAGWGVSSHSKYKAEAADFVLFLSNPVNNVKFCKQYSVIPIHSTAASLDPFFESGPFAPYIYQATHPENYFMSLGKPRPLDSEISQEADMNFVLVLTGEKSARDVLNDWSGKLNSIY